MERETVKSRRRGNRRKNKYVNLGYNVISLRFVATGAAAAAFLSINLAFQMLPFI